MARRTSRREAAPARAPRASAKSKKKAKAASADVEVVEDDGQSLDTMIILATTFALVVAIGFTDALLGKFGAGVLF